MVCRLNQSKRVYTNSLPETTCTQKTSGASQSSTLYGNLRFLEFQWINLISLASSVLNLKVSASAQDPIGSSLCDIPWGISRKGALFQLLRSKILEAIWDSLEALKSCHETEYVHKISSPNDQYKYWASQLTEPRISISLQAVLSIRHTYFLHHHHPLFKDNIGTAAA